MLNNIKLMSDIYNTYSSKLTHLIIEQFVLIILSSSVAFIFIFFLVNLVSILEESNRKSTKLLIN